MKLLKLITAGILFALSANANASEDDISFSFGPAPVNLAGEKDAWNLEVNLVDIAIENTSGMTATTLTVSKKSVSASSATKKYLYVTNIDSEFYSSASGFGLGISYATGSGDGFAGMLGLNMDVQNFYSINNPDEFTETATIGVDLGLQTHMRVSDSFVFIPWAKYTYTSGYTDIPSAPDVIDISYSAPSFGMDMVFNTISLGAMYQENESTSITSLRLSVDF